MNHRAIFLNALSQNEDDIPTRMIYADWLEEHGEPEEADRQRQWPAAKAWLVRFCQQHNPHDWVEDDEYFYIISYRRLLELGRQAIKELENSKEFEWAVIDCRANQDMCDALRKHGPAFWKNWSVVTGIAVPADVAENARYGCSC